MEAANFLYPQTNNYQVNNQAQNWDEAVLKRFPCIVAEIHGSFRLSNITGRIGHNQFFCWGRRKVGSGYTPEFKDTRLLPKVRDPLILEGACLLLASWLTGENSTPNGDFRELPVKTEEFRKC